MFLCITTSKMRLVSVSVCLTLITLTLMSDEVQQKLTTSEDKMLLEEYLRRSMYTREVCEAWGSKSSKTSFLSAPPRYKVAVTSNRNLTTDRRFLSKQQLVGIWTAMRSPSFRKLVVDEKYDVTWCKVPKAASTSWVKIFMKASHPQVQYNDAPGGNLHKVFRRTYRHLPDDVIVKILPQHLKLLVTRHPFERLVSAYRDKLENIERDKLYGRGYFYVTYGKNIVLKYREKGSNLTEAQQEPTFNEFVQYLLGTDVSSYDSHWMPIFYLCSPCTVRYDVISSMETLEADSDYIIRNRRMEAGKLERAHSNNINSGDSFRYFQKLTNEQIHRLYLVYLMDFLLFDYDHKEYFN